jgi:hypothetical protein
MSSATEYELRKAKEMALKDANELWEGVLHDMSMGDNIKYSRGDLVIMRLLIELIKK